MPRSIRWGSARASSRLTTSRRIPTPNDPGIDGVNLVGYRFAAPINNAFNTYIGRVDFRHSNGQTFFGRFNVQDDSVLSVPEFPAPRRTPIGR